MSESIFLETVSDMTSQPGPYLGHSNILTSTEDLKVHHATASIIINL